MRANVCISHVCRLCTHAREWLPISRVCVPLLHTQSHSHMHECVQVCVCVNQAAVVIPVGDLLAPSGLCLCQCSYYAAWWLGPQGVSLFNTGHRWVAPRACCGSLPPAGSSGHPDSTLIRLTVTRIPIPSHSVSLRPCLSGLCVLSAPLSLFLSVALALSLQCCQLFTCSLNLRTRGKIHGVSGTGSPMASWEWNV